MEEISEKGVVIILASLTLGFLLFLGLYFLNFTLTESRIAKSQVVATQAYYLAEAGIDEAIWKLKNDPDWKSNFAQEPGCYTWSASFSRSNVLFSNGSYSVQIQNSDCARAQIISTSTLALSESKTAQRVVKTKVFKALGSLTQDSPIFGDGNVNVTVSRLNVHNGNIYSNGNIVLIIGSTVNIYDNPATEEQEGQALAQGNIDIDWSSELNSSSTCAQNVCTELCSSCPLPPANIPMVDFDSDALTSYKSRANTAQQQGQCLLLAKKAGQTTTTLSTNCIFTENDFRQLLWDVGQEGILTLVHKTNGVAVSTYYVTGNVDLKGNRTLVINGVLVADGNVSIGEDRCWKRAGQKNCGFNQIKVIDPGQGTPSGILAKGNIKFGLFSSFTDTRMEGLIYTLGNFDLISTPNYFEIIGGEIAAGNFDLISIFQDLDIYLDNTKIQEGVWAGPDPPPGGKPPFSPIVTIEHWEETY